MTEPGNCPAQGNPGDCLPGNPEDASRCLYCGGEVPSPGPGRGTQWAGTLEALEVLEEKRTHLREALARSLALLALVPDAFRAGPARSWTEGNRNAFRFVVVRGDGSREVLDLEDVPRILWPPALVREAETREAREGRPRNRRGPWPPAREAEAREKARKAETRKAEAREGRARWNPRPPGGP